MALVLINPAARRTDHTADCPANRQGEVVIFLETTNILKSVGQFLKNKSQHFQGGLRGYPQTKIEIFSFINLENIYLGKVNEFQDRVSYNKHNFENVVVGVESMSNRVKCLTFQWLFHTYYQFQFKMP